MEVQTQLNEVLLKVKFTSSQEDKLAEQFFQQGYLCFPVTDQAVLAQIRHLIISSIVQFFNCKYPENESEFLNHVHQRIDVSQLNALRLSVINVVRRTEWFRPSYFHLAKQALEIIVGNELAMQRSIGLSVQLPSDDSSLLNIHADSWSGDSPFEVVVWLPLVDCFATKSMFILRPQAMEKINKNFGYYSTLSNKAFYSEIKDEVEFVTVPYGHFLLFNQNLPHGNLVNQESETRLSMNCRFKSVFSPYKDKKLGEFFEPITLKAASRIGMSYKYPQVK